MTERGQRNRLKMLVGHMLTVCDALLPLRYSGFEIAKGI